MDACETRGEVVALLKRFSANCEQLELDSAIQHSAFETYRRLAADGGLPSSGDEAQEWLCCAVYSELQLAKLRDIKTESQGVGNHCWNLSLTRLLRGFKVNASVFLRRMEHWNWLAQNKKVFQLEVEELRRRFSVTLLLLQHYKRIFQRLFSQPSGGESDADALALYHSLYEFGWLFFLIVRNELPGFATENLVNGCQVLVCCMDLLYVNMLEVQNSAIIRRDFPGLPAMWGTKEFDSEVLNKYSALQTIGTLVPQLPEKGVQQMKNAFFKKALIVLFMDQMLLGNDTHMREIIKEGMLDINLATLNRKYSSHVADIGEMDERVMLCCQEAKGRVKDSKSSLPRLVSQSSSSSSCSSPYKKLLDHKLPQSLPPIIKALGKGENYDAIVHPVEQLLLMLGRTFTTAAKDHMNEQVAGERFHLAKGLCYKFLAKIVASELALKPQLKLGNLLKQYTMTTALVACCLELALHIHDKHVDAVRFPFVLDCYSLNAYDFQKILELVVRHDDGLLGRELVRHLHTVEDKCLGTLIFRDNSQLWRIFEKIDRFPSYQEVQIKVEDKENPSTGATICLRKFYSLAHRRLLGLCRRLSLVDAYPRIWHLAEYSFTLKGSQLLRERNLDLLLLCAVHLHARLEDSRLTFSEIIQEYRRQPHAESSVYRQVSLDSGQSADIIGFYNTTYVRSMARYGLHLRCDQHTPAKSLSELKRNVNVTIPQEASPKMLRMRNNISVSSPPAPKICPSGSCSSIDLAEPIGSRSPIAITNQEEKLNPNLNLKRSASSNEIHADKQPNILRRRTCFH